MALADKTLLQINYAVIIELSRVAFVQAIESLQRMARINVGRTRE